MDDRAFDRITRKFAGLMTRRELTAALLAARGVLLSSGDVNAKEKCQSSGGSCRKDGECCSGSCEWDNRSGRNICVAKPVPKCDSMVCGELCCPAEAVGCASIDVSGGTNISCQCPRGQELIDGQCKAIECPSGANYAGLVARGDLTNENLCCSYPLNAYCVC